MSFFNAFKNQIGRDTGKVVSNLVWGDKHASVYRRAQSRYETQKLEARLEEKQAENRAFERLIQEQKIDKALECVDKGVARIISMKVPHNKELLIEMLQELTMMLIANPWKSVFNEENNITNRYSDAILQKYEQVLFTLKSKFLNDVEVSYFEKQYIDLKKGKRKGKFTEIIIAITLAVILSAIIAVMAYQENAQKEKKPSIIEKFESIMKK